MAQIKEYAEALKDRLESGLGLNIPYRYGLVMRYHRSWGASSEFGHEHKFTIREGHSLVDRYLGEMVLKGIFFDKHFLGAGKHIYVYNSQHFNMIKAVVERLNEETSIDFVVRKYFAVT